MERSDVFICHASEDKSTFVDPLANRLKNLSVRVWFDSFVIEPGDRLTEKIADGVANCRNGLIVLSPAFIGKPWTKYELSGLLNRFVEDGPRLIPVWLDISRPQIAKFNPMIADIRAISGGRKQINEIALEILKLVRPQLYENIIMMGKLKDPTFKFQVRKIPIKNLDFGPVRHHDLPSALLIRIQNIHFALRDVLSTSLNETIEDFQRDLHPEQEVEIWEQVVSAVTRTMDSLATDDIVVKKQILGFLLRFTSRENIDELVQENAGDPKGMTVLSATMEAWLDIIPKIAVSDVDIS